MKLSELTADELEVLKQHYLMAKNKNVSYKDLNDADNLVTYEDLETMYGGIEFSEDDFIGEFDESEDKIINFDLRGLPEYAMSIKDIIRSFGGTYNKETCMWEIPDSKNLDEHPILLKDDGTGYGANEQYLISGAFSENGQYHFFRDKELEYVDIYDYLNVYPGCIVKDSDEKEWMIITVIETDGKYVFRCYEFELNSFKNGKPIAKEFSIDEIKKMSRD